MADLQLCGAQHEEWKAGKCLKLDEILMDSDCCEKGHLVKLLKLCCLPAFIHIHTKALDACEEGHRWQHAFEFLERNLKKGRGSGRSRSVAVAKQSADLRVWEPLRLNSMNSPWF